MRRSLKLQDSSKMNERGDIIHWIGNRDYIVFAENKSIYGSRSCFGFLFCFSLFLCCAHYLIVIIIITIYISDYGDGTKIGSAKVADLVGVKQYEN